MFGRPLAFFCVLLAPFSLAPHSSGHHLFVGFQVAFKNLPRLTFGNLQAKLFPIYFKVLTGSAVVVLVVYAAKHAADGPFATKSGASLQLAALAGTLVFTLMNLLVLGAPSLLCLYFILP